MTERARLVLQDCEHAISKHSLSLTAEAFRVSWVSIGTLLRAVGHVLHKVDGPTSSAMAAAVDAKWSELKASRPHPAIYWHFIEQERNNVLKLYQLNVRRDTIFRNRGSGGRSTLFRIDEVNARGGETIGGDDRRVSHIATGPFAERYERELALEAHHWWASFLDEVDVLATRLVLVAPPSRPAG